VPSPLHPYVLVIWIPIVSCSLLHHTLAAVDLIQILRQFIDWKLRNPHSSLAPKLSALPHQKLHRVIEGRCNTTTIHRILWLVGLQTTYISTSPSILTVSLPILSIARNTGLELGHLTSTAQQVLLSLTSSVDFVRTRRVLFEGPLARSSPWARPRWPSGNQRMLLLSASCPFMYQQNPSPPLFPLRNSSERSRNPKNGFSSHLRWRRPHHERKPHLQIVRLGQLACRERATLDHLIQLLDQGTSMKTKRWDLMF